MDMAKHTQPKRLARRRAENVNAGTSNPGFRLPPRAPRSQRIEPQPAPGAISAQAGAMLARLQGLSVRLADLKQRVTGESGSAGEPASANESIQSVLQQAHHAMTNCEELLSQINDAV